VLAFRGYIDESHDNAKIPKLFTLSCIIGFDNMLPWFEMAWTKVLEDKNEQLRQEGRQPISRYHAVYCNNLRGEYKDWSVEEQIEFSLKLFKVFRHHPIHIHSYDLPLQLMVQEIPETQPNPIGFAYVILLRMLMEQICEETLRLYPCDEISLHHDQCNYDGALADAFSNMLADPLFKCSGRFTSITPEQGRHCVMLQPADMIAYENFKDGMRLNNPNGRERRKSLKTILDLDAISGRAQGFTIEGIRQLKKNMDALDKKTKDILFASARIR
jgi:hypothetical protein